MHYQLFIEALIRLSMAVVIGGVLGFERHLHGRWTGLRTHMTVALASAVFVMAIDSTGSNAETARVMQGVAAGIGFLQISERALPFHLASVGVGISAPVPR